MLTYGFTRYETIAMQNDLVQPYDDLPELLSKAAKPSSVSDPARLMTNDFFAEQLGVSTDWLHSPEALAWLSGSAEPEHYNSVATAYAGFQFGQYNPQLGDGRALLLGELSSPTHERFEIQLKGAGRTPFSRGGDGRSALGPVIREYIVSEAMHVLGVPTTRALMALSTGDSVIRERSLPGGILVRVAPSHIRFGSFQYAAARGDVEALTALLTRSFELHYHTVPLAARNAPTLLRLVTERTAELIARWDTLGFIHGVMNTDNMSIGGLTIDYGPCAFQDQFSWEQVFSSIDTAGRYRYSQQPAIALWNLARLAEALLPLFKGTDSEVVAEAESILSDFMPTFERYRLTLYAQKLGLAVTPARFDDSIKPLLDYLEQKQLDFTLSFAYLESIARHDQSATTLITQASPELSVLDECSIVRSFTPIFSGPRVNPLLIPRNHLVEAAITAAETGDSSQCHTLFTNSTHPYDLGALSYQDLRPAKPGDWIGRTFCGT